MPYRKVGDQDDYIATCGLTATALKVLFVLMRRVEVDYHVKRDVVTKSKVSVTITAQGIADILHLEAKTVRDAIRLLSDKDLVIRAAKWEYLVNPKYFWHYGEWVFRSDMKKPNLDIYQPAVDYWHKACAWYHAKKGTARGVASPKRSENV